jgi:hypothetical protein
MTIDTTALSLPSGLVVFSRSGMELTRTPSYEEWFQLGRYLSAARRHSIRWMADWRLAGRREFGDEKVAEAESQLELDFKDLKAAAALEKLECRVPGLTDEHHFVAAQVKDFSTEERSYWLQRAQDEKLSPVELRDSMKKGEVVRAAEKEKNFLNSDDRSTGIVTIEGVAMQFDIWLRKVREKEFPAGSYWDTRRLSMVAELLRPMAEQWHEVLRLLGEKEEETRP